MEGLGLETRDNCLDSEHNLDACLDLVIFKDFICAISY